MIAPIANERVRPNVTAQERVATLSPTIAGAFTINGVNSLATKNNVTAVSKLESARIARRCRVQYGRIKLKVESAVFTNSTAKKGQKNLCHAGAKVIFIPSLSNSVCVQSIFSHQIPKIVLATNSIPEAVREIRCASRTAGSLRGLQSVVSQFLSFALSSTAKTAVTTVNGNQEFIQRTPRSLKTASPR